MFSNRDRKAARKAELSLNSETYRAYNHGADTECNTTLDHEHDHIYEDHSTNRAIHNNNNNNLFLQTDGGCRTLGMSATGWRLRTYRTNKHDNCITLARGGTIHDSNMTSLEIEAKAMLGAITFIDRELNKANPLKIQKQTQFGKRRRQLEHKREET